MSLLNYKINGGTDAVYGGRDDASGVAGSLSAGIEVLQVNVLEGMRIAGKAHGRGGAGLHCKEQGLGGIVAPQLAVKCRKGLAQAVGDEIGQNVIEVRGKNRSCAGPERRMRPRLRSSGVPPPPGNPALPPGRRGHPPARRK